MRHEAPNLRMALAELAGLGGRTAGAYRDMIPVKVAIGQDVALGLATREAGQIRGMACDIQEGTTRADGLTLGNFPKRALAILDGTPPPVDREAAQAQKRLDAAARREKQGRSHPAVTPPLPPSEPSPAKKEASALQSQLHRTREEARELREENKRLKAQATAPPAGVELPLSALRLDGGTQTRCRLNEEHVERCAEALAEGGALPPVVAYHDGKDHWLADGFHREAAHRKAGRDTIRVDVRQGTRRDAVLHSAGANAEHTALPRGTDDKRRAVLALLQDEEWGQWADRDIARRCRVSPTFVGKVRAALAPPPATVHGGQLAEPAPVERLRVEGIEPIRVEKLEPLKGEARRKYERAGKTQTMKTGGRKKERAAPTVPARIDSPHKELASKVEVSGEGLTCAALLDPDARFHAGLAEQPPHVLLSLLADVAVEMHSRGKAKKLHGTALGHLLEDLMWALGQVLAVPAPAGAP